VEREDLFYEALKTRDPRFDGKFFVGVRTTGIYCRPICPARPKRENVEFFSSHLDAERAGYRPCQRCRPESAPGSAAWVGTSAIVRRALKALHAQSTVHLDEEQFASRFGVSARHLRRLFAAEVGKTPKQLAMENRLNLSRKLLVETQLPITHLAFGAGFSSVRRFNDAFKARFKQSPRQIRRYPLNPSDGVTVTLSYRPPFDFLGLLSSYASHRVAELEWFENERMHRIVEFGEKVGKISVANDAHQSRLLLTIDFPDTSWIHAIVTRVRELFDLDADPVLIANALEDNAKFESILTKYPGIRLPSGWDSFEIAVSAILGQAVSVPHGRALVHALVKHYGRPATWGVNQQPIKLFPTPQRIADSDLRELKTTTSRKQALIAFSSAVADGVVSLEPTQDVDKFIANVTALRGIGVWTASYMALKVLRHTDAFPATDLILARALKDYPQEVMARVSPWRGYVAALLWREHGASVNRKGDTK